MKLHDYCDLLESFDPGSRRYRAAYQRYHRLLRDQPDALGDADQGGLFTSVRAWSIRGGWACRTGIIRRSSAPRRSRQPALGRGRNDDAGGRREIVATRMACTELDVLSAAFPGMVRCPVTGASKPAGPSSGCASTRSTTARRCSCPTTASPSCGRTTPIRAWSCTPKLSCAATANWCECCSPTATCFATAPGRMAASGRAA